MFPFKDRYFFNLDYNEHLEFEYVVDATNVSNIGNACEARIGALFGRFLISGFALISNLFAPDNI